MWDAIKEFGNKLVDNLPVLLVVAGLVLFVLGAAGGISYSGWLPVADTPGRGILVIGGIALVLFGVMLRGGGGGGGLPNPETTT